MSDMLSSLQNAAMAKKPEIEVFFSNECENVVKVLKEKGFLEEIKVFKPKGKSYKMINLKLAHDNGIFKLTKIKRVSKPGKRIYVSYSNLHPVYSGYGSQIVSTSKGVMDGLIAKKKKLGGELICEVR